MSHGIQNPSLLAPGEGELFEALGVSLVLKTRSADSDGQFFVMEYHAPPEFAGPPPHLHKITTELFYVLEGALTLRVGEQTRQVGAGGYAYVPPGHLHGFSNETEVAAKFLGISTPGVLDDYLVEMKTLVESQPEWPPSDQSQFLALMTRFDTFMPDAP